jgi:PLP dependent protein
MAEKGLTHGSTFHPGNVFFLFTLGKAGAGSYACIEEVPCPPGLSDPLAFSIFRIVRYGSWFDSQCLDRLTGEYPKELSELPFSKRRLLGTVKLLSMDLSPSIKDVHDRIRRACDLAQRDPDHICLIAVSKTYSIDHIKAAYDLGLRHFGENRIQEAIPKVETLPADITWHFIGKLQSNKVRRAAELFQVIHTLETDSQLQEFAKVSRPVDALIEVNVGNESQKSGVSLSDLDEFHEKALKCYQIRLRGLMGMGPAKRNAEEMRPFFRALKERSLSLGGQWLSMGMSSDFEVGIQEGATHVRVGSALFGARS